MDFDDELKGLLDLYKFKPFAEQEKAVAALHRKHGREVPPPITGTINVTEPKDAFKK
jgi:hypothetical protein